MIANLTMMLSFIFCLAFMGMLLWWNTWHKIMQRVPMKPFTRSVSMNAYWVLTFATLVGALVSIGIQYSVLRESQFETLFGFLVL
jgi:hypothetical protein